MATLVIHTWLYLLQYLTRTLLLACVFVYAQTSRNLEKAIAASEKQRNALQSRVRFLSHECRVPLNSVVLGLDFCQEGAKSVRQALSAVRRRRSGQQGGGVGPPDEGEQSGM